MPANCEAKLILLLPFLRRATEAPRPTHANRATEAQITETMPPRKPKKPSYAGEKSGRISAAF